MRILILGGSSEATLLARQLADEPTYSPVLSLAGRTRNPVLPPIPHRIGGFGGIAGLIEYLRREAVEAVIDATHPFAERMSANAEAAARETGVPLAVFTRPPWNPAPDDRWTEVPDAQAAALALGALPRRVFLTVGRLQLGAFATAPQHEYLIRSIDPPEPPPALPRHRVILARGPFKLEHEIALMQRERIDQLVTKNSGGEAARAKIVAARHLGLEVILMRPPPRGAVPVYHELGAVLAFLGRRVHDTASDPRGV